MDFLKQLLGNKSKGNPPPSFEELIANVADSPTAANRNAVQSLTGPHDLRNVSYRQLGADLIVEADLATP